MRDVLLGVISVGLLFCGRGPGGLPADTILVNGKIVVMDDAFSLAEALAVRDGKVAAVGSTVEIERLRGQSTRVIDLIVLSEDILTIDPNRILEIEVEATMVGGEVLWGAMPGKERNDAKAE